MILLGWSLGDLWKRLKAIKRGQVIRVGLLISAVAVIIVGMIASSIRVWRLQKYRYDSSLKQIGLWLKENTPPGTTVQLEPLGYAGYYSNRIMLDEVGLVTPRVVEMKRVGITRAEEYTQLLQPDAYVIHCDDAARVSRGDDEVERWVLEHYQPAATFDPLDFHLTSEDDENPPSNLARASCYEVWVVE
jgi:hypothetical protein